MRYLTWPEFDHAICEMATRVRILKRSWPGVCIVGEPRGGLPLAVALSHYTDIPIALSPKLLPTTTPLIWVDDVLDSGATFKQAGLDYLCKKCRRWEAVVWVDKTGGQFPDVFPILEMPRTEWIVFPWEDPNRAAAEEQEYRNR